ncbi:MAG: HEAT repeat domain-containing protein [Chthoniobacteraceae bacterium]
MNISLKFSIRWLLPVLCGAGLGQIQAGVDIDRLLGNLRSPDLKVRRTAVDDIQLVEDPRIPEACLPLLADEGLSIRRQAARAIGSRFYQIDTAQLPTYTAALREYQRTATEEPRGVATRALGLLQRDFSSPMFSVSPNRKWVLYEQRRRPMIADLALHNRQLLAPTIPPDDVSNHFAPQTRVVDGEIQEGPGRSSLLKLMTTNGPVAEQFAPCWRPDGSAVALQPEIQARFFRPVCIWRASDRACRVFTHSMFRRFYGKHFPHWSTYMEIEAWKGNKVVLHVYDCDESDPQYDPKGIYVSVEVTDWKLALEKEARPKPLPAPTHSPAG